jgi:predicted transcriptional regulator
VPKGKDKSGRLSVFKGREARLNKAIFHLFALECPQTIYGIHKEMKAQKGLRDTRYANANKRVRALEESGYIKKKGMVRTKAGFQAFIYELTTKAYLAMMLNRINLDNLLLRVDDAAVQAILATILGSTKPYS